ncbi:MAG: sugar ABC transporter permease [Xylanivirga thermophila]|uniref:carbohydrate ABC transporter permease n=1 Tax=Xylanivirga thermophila TaxID=2496273 RepID=UPI0013EB5859|nr:sugar ABC transporter permease [Xylanivirga thermophila]
MSNQTEIVKSKTRLKSKNQKIAPYIFIGPAMIYLTIVTFLPAIMALPISFSDWSALSPKMNFIGLDNYSRLFRDPAFKKSIIVMAKFFISVPLIMLVGLIVAMLLNNDIKGITFFRVVYYSPVITSTIAAAILFDWFFQPTFGLFNSIRNAIGLSSIGWVSDAKTAVRSVIIFRVWKGAGAAMLIYLAGLKDIPQSLIEAAEIDGTNWWQRFCHITFPLLKPANLYLAITGVIGVFMIFQETYMLQGPLKSTYTVVNYIYDKAFLSSEMGYASAASFLLFIIVFTVTLLQYKFLKLDEE